MRQDCPVFIKDLIRYTGLVRNPWPPRIATGEVGDATEGRIITIAGVITGIFDDGIYGVQFTVDDGSGAVMVFVHSSTGINPFEVPFIGLGKRVQVTGFSSRFADEVELQPGRCRCSSILRSAGGSCARRRTTRWRCRTRRHPD
jgi:hypothetical protein